VAGRRARDTLKWAKKVLRTEAKAIASLEARLNGAFVDAVELMRGCTGRVVVTAIGKPGFIAQKMSATLASVGVPSLYLHPAEAVHGDLGRLARGDVVVALSNSGATAEVLALMGPLKHLGVPVVAVTGDRKSPLASHATVVIDIGWLDEASPLGLVPTTSSAALHAITDALAVSVAHERELTPEAYGRRHPGGKLGRSILRVADVMRTGDALPLAKATDPISKVVVVMTNTQGRPGAALIVDGKKKLLGIFTDGDLRRLLERGKLDFSARVNTVMGKHPRCVGPGELVLEAAAVMRDTQVDQLPVVDSSGRVAGLLDVQDVLAARVG
jgi:arabinose-5-phosphate isomerase